MFDNFNILTNICHHVQVYIYNFLKLALKFKYSVIQIITNRDCVISLFHNIYRAACPAFNKGRKYFVTKQEQKQYS